MSRARIAMCAMLVRPRSVTLSSVLVRRETQERLPVFDRLPAIDQEFRDRPGHFGGDLVHDLHRLDDADRLPDLDRVTNVDEGRLAGAGRAIERPEHRRGDDRAL